ncbi:MAG TPA: hypothetical protein VF721_18425 [Pyrinomonadaceae bacterium]|jgi:hypothetical protein
MNDRDSRAIEITALSLSIIVTALAMLHAGAWKIDLVGLLIMLLTISPYICLFLADIGLRKTAPNLKMSSVFCAASLLMLGFTLLTYIGTLGDSSSTYALIFLFVPFYLYVGGAIFLGGGLLWALLSKASGDKNT